MNDYLFYGAMTEPIAPMDKEGNIDYELLKAQVQFQLDHKIHAIFVSGLTECMVTSVDEQIEMLRETVKTVNGQVPVMGNICLNRPEDALSTIKAFEEAGADAISLINTLTGMAVDVYKKKPILANIVGGLSGPAVRPVALRMVWQASRAVNVPVIGMGGIMTGEDAAAFMLCGASAVMVGTANIHDPMACVNIIDELEKYCDATGVNAVSELTGALEV